MAAFKFPFSSDIPQSKKSNLLKKFDQKSISYLSGLFSIRTNPSTKLNPIGVSRLSTDLVEISEPNEEDKLILKTPLPNNDIRKNPRDIWKRAQPKKVIRRKFYPNSDSKNKEFEEIGETPLPQFVYNGGSHHELEAWFADIGVDLDIKHCNYILKELEKRGDETKTLRFFELMRSNGKLNQNVFAYSFALRVLGRKEDWEAAEMLLQEVIEKFASELSYHVFNTLIYACFKRGLSELGTKWFRMMLENDVRPNVATLGMLMNLYQKGYNVAEAKFAFEKMREFDLKCESAYSAMVTIYTRLGLYDKVDEVICLMKEDNLVLDLENWLVQLNAYSQQGKLEEADRVLMAMGEAGIPPNIVTYNTLITGYGKVSNMAAAERLFVSLPDIGLEPDETTYRSMVEGWGRADCYEEAKRYYSELKRSGFEPNDSNTHTMINLQAKYDDEEGLSESLEDMRRISCQYSYILSNLLHAYEKLDKVDKLPQVLKGFMYEHVLEDQASCSSLVMCYVKHCLVDDALQVLREKKWKNSAFEGNLYHLLICSCKESGHYEGAVKIFLNMPSSDGSPKLHVTCTMIGIYSLMGRFKEAEDLYLKLQASGVALDMVAYHVVVRMYIKSGSLNDACAVLDTMEKQKDIVPNIFLLRDMFRLYQKCGLQEKLADLYYRVLKSGIFWDEDMYNCVINCCARALPVDDLSRIFDEMLQRGFSPNTIAFNVLLDVYGKAKLFKKARKVFSIAQKRGLTNVISYNTIISAYGHNNDLKLMQSSVRKMQFNGFTVSLEVYTCMLDAYGKQGQMESFQNVLERMKEANVAPDHYTYSTMINIYGEQRWIEEVANVLTELKESGLGPDLYSYNTLIKAYGIAGMIEEAVAVVKEMRENGIEPDRITYVNLVRALQRNDNFLEAVKWSLWMKQMGMSTEKS